ncbi:hypothetical protein [Citrobacter freundii]|uniref:hypothetical protein n=1 Tax=Citrobacter freundii TaxID=546 RepID=UPI001C7DD777|nr:hypothetical protein [Citrobacter freundii]
MGSNIIELAKLGHERAAELKSSCGAVDVRSLAQLISDLATQLEVQLVRGNAQAVQLANSESKCRELAAENARLKAAAEFATAEDMWIEQHDGMLDYRYSEWYVDVLKAAMETPATDAFLAEVRAQGVEMMAAEADQLMNEFGDDSYKVMVTADLQRFANAFAAQLRKGGAL